MQQKNVRLLIIPLISLSIFLMIVFSATYAYFIANTSMNTSNYQITMPQVTTLMCTKTDCSINVTPSMMTNTNTSDTAKTSSNCSLNCTCSGTPGAVCDYNVRLIEMVTEYTPSIGLESNKEFTAKVTNSSNCTIQNSSNIETQVNTLRDKIVSNCSITVPQSGSASANVSIEFKWYNLDLNQDNHIQKRYIYQLSNDNQTYTVTFDANGGSVGTSSKQVVYGEVYGELPTPIWEGHTFRGWNGKNKFNKALSQFGGIKNETPIQSWGYVAYSNQAVINNLKPSTYYRISYYIECVKVPDYDTKYSANLGFILYSGKGSNPMVNTNTGSYMLKGQTMKVSTTIMTPSTLHDTSANYRLLAYTNRYLLNNAEKLGSMTFSKIQIEEGTVETLYEPYYVTETTKVTQAKDHTLTAIWD